MAENSVDESQDPTVRQYEVRVSSISHYKVEIECTDAEKWALDAARSRIRIDC